LARTHFDKFPIIRIFYILHTVENREPA